MGERIESLRWDLSPLVESENPDRVKASMDECLKQAEAFEKKYRGRISELSASDIYELHIELDNSLTEWLQLRNYAVLRHRQDVEDKTSIELYEYALKVDAAYRSKLVFHEIELAQTLLERQELVNDSALYEYRHSLERTMERGKYLLPESDEKLIMNKDIYGVDSWFQLHQQLKNTRKYKVVIDREEKELGFTEIRSIAESSPDRNSRKAATEALYEGISQDSLVYASALKSVFGNYLYELELRKIPTVLTESLMQNDISHTTLDALISTIRMRTDFIRKYLTLRAKVMGLPKLTGYDISPVRLAPIIETQSSISWSEIKRLLIESFSQFDKEAGEFMTDLLEKGRIDVGARPGKSGQAFCTNFPELRTSYILTTSDDAATITELAHECGHGLHGYYASEKHKWINSFDSGGLIELGSIFGEILVSDKMLEESTDIDKKLVILDMMLSGVYTMLYFILNAYEFEKRVFDILQNKEPIDGEKLGAIWMNIREDIFGDSVDWLPGMEYDWTIPAQFFWPRTQFYNYPYAFGKLLVFALFRLYKEEGSSFIPKMKRILSAGASESPKNLLAEVGLDISDPKFWEIGFELAQEYLDEYEAIVKKKT
ncbi:MAG: M3 family oligoendopeptidase [Candidatus Sifarchaeia archaeon]